MVICRQYIVPVFWTRTIVKAGRRPRGFPRMQAGGDHPLRNGRRTLGKNH